jgi:hypothetical protein
MDTPAWLEKFSDWQRRVILTEDHQYLVQMEPGGPFLPVPGCTDVIPKDKGSVNALRQWGVDTVLDSIVEAIPRWDMRTDPAEYLRSFRTAHLTRRDKAADAGTDMHALFEHEARLMLGQNPPRPERTPEQQIIVNKWLRWAERVKLRPFAVEARVFHPKYMHAGTMDLGAYMFGEDKPYVIDWKPLKKGKKRTLYNQYILQSASYRASLQAMTDHEEEFPGYICHYPVVGNNADVDGQVVPGALKDAYVAFRGALAFHRWCEANKPAWQRRKAS